MELDGQRYWLVPIQSIVPAVIDDASTTEIVPEDIEFEQIIQQTPQSTNPPKMSKKEKEAKEALERARERLNSEDFRKGRI